jgi:hypothetical protein
MVVFNYDDVMFTWCKVGHVLLIEIVTAVELMLLYYAYMS